MTGTLPSVTAASLRVVLLGRAEVRTDRLLHLHTGALRLLAFLALRGPSLRAVVAGALRPEADAGHAAGCLRTALWRMQRADRRLVCTSADVEGVAPDVSVDLHEVTAASLAAEGDLAEAARQYDALAGLLSAELGVPPAAETRRLVYAAGSRIPDPRSPGW